MLLGVLVAIVIGVALWIASSYNRLVSLRRQAFDGWRQIDVQLKRRHDLIPNLVNAVRGSMETERETLAAVMEARSRALAATGPADAAHKEGQLAQALGGLLAAAGRVAALEMDDRVRRLREELSAAENKVGVARQYYNDTAAGYNAAQHAFPSNLLAAALGFRPAELFEITTHPPMEAPRWP